MRGGLTVITDRVIMGQQLGDTWGLWIAKAIGVTAPEAEVEVVTQFYSVALSTLRIDPTWLKYQIEGARIRSEMARATLKRIMAMDYAMFQAETTSMQAIGEGWGLALSGQGARVDPKGNEYIVPINWNSAWVDKSGRVAPGGGPDGMDPPSPDAILLR